MPAETVARPIIQVHRSGLHLREAGRNRPPPGGGQPAVRRPTVITVLYVHGLGESGLCFEGLLGSPVLDGYRQLALDLPGYGKTPWSEEPPGLEQHASTIAQWLEREHREPVVVVGHSMGGVIGQLLCEGWPERTRALCNVEGNISRADCTFSARANAHSEPDFVRSGFARLLDDVFAAGQRERALRQYFASLSGCDPRTLHRNSVELVALSEQESLAGRLGALDRPRCYLFGRPGGTGDHSRALLQANGVTPIAIEGAAHWPFLDQPERFLAVLLGFLADLSA